MLAKYKKTKVGSGIVDVPDRKIEMPSRGQATRSIRRLEAIERKKANDAQRTFRLNLRNSLLKGSISETQFYIENAENFRRQMLSTTDETVKITAENSMLSSMESAQSAAERASNKAQSQAETVANLMIFEEDIAVKAIGGSIEGGLRTGAYENPSEYIDDLEKLKLAQEGAYVNKINKTGISEIERRRAEEHLKGLRESYDDKTSTKEFGGLKYMKENKDIYHFMQTDDGTLRLAEEATFTGKDIEYKGGTKYVRGKGGSYYRVKPLLAQKDDFTYIFFNPETREHEEFDILEDAVSIDKYRDAEMVEVVNAQDPKDRVTFFQESGEEGSWKQIGGGDEMFEKPGWYRPEPATTGGMVSGGIEPIMEKPKMIEPVKEGPSLDVPDIKRDIRKDKQLDGSHKFFEGDSEIAKDKYLKISGAEPESIKDEDYSNNPLGLMRQAGIGAMQQGYSKFKNIFGKYLNK